MALIPPFFLNSVVSIGIENDNQKQWIGTGFVVGRLLNPDKEEKLYNTYIVTNKHVIANKNNIILRFNTLNGNDVLDYSIKLIEDNKNIWVGHPSSNVDVAAFFINPTVLEKDSAEFGYFKLDEHIMTIQDMKNEGISEGDGIFTLGFPMGIVAPQKKHVIARLGAIARIRDVLENQQSNFIIDANVFPGNSGGPVIIKPEAMSIQGTQSINRAALIGIVKSYLPYKDVAVSQQTGNPRVIFEENSGLALVETVNKVIETVDICHSETFPS